MRILMLAFCAVLPTATTPLVAQSTSSAERVSLPQVLDSVAARYPLIRAANARIQAARGARSTAGALGNPMLMYQVENAALPGQSAPPMDRESMLTATIPLEPLYQRWSRVNAANAEIRAAENNAIREQQRLELEATHAFYRVARSQVAVAATQDLVAWLDSVVSYNRARVTEGAAAEADLIRSELERDRTEAEATMQEADLARARADLSVFLTDKPALATFLVAALDAPLTLPDVPTMTDGSGRPDIRAARARVSSAASSVTTERTSILRQFGVTVGTKRTAGTTSLIAGLALPFPLFDQNRGAMTRASAERDAAAFELAALERIAQAEIIGASESVRLLTERARVLAGAAPNQSYLRRAEEARRIALGAYREGAIPLIQVLDAARTWAEAQVTYHQILYAQHESVIELLVAEGLSPGSIGPKEQP